MNDMTTLSVEHTFEEEASTSPGSRPASVVERERNVLGHEIEEETSFALLESNEDVKDEQTAGHDMAGEGKQKRKRTSPRDQAILEAEYKSNPKPNKSARAEIVEKVSLNEKEVQIWFQNRRQINRRKSRPLLPHEIAAFGLGGMAAFSSDPLQLASSSPSQPGGTGSQSDTNGSQEEESQRSRVELSTPHHPIVRDFGRVEVGQSIGAGLANPPLLKQRSSSASLPAGESFSSSDVLSRTFSSTPGYLANRWNSTASSFSTPATSQKQSQDFVTPTIATKEQPNSCSGRLERTKSGSKIRLSMSLDGKAELVTGSPTPSPPRSRPQRPVSPVPPAPIDTPIDPPAKRLCTLERSQSAYTLSASSPMLPALTTGRSRDARSWQICCDGDVKDELTAHAERESGGSATAAIGLIRSASNSALKAATASKRNSTRVPKQAAGKQSGKPKMARAQSSLARLQYTNKTHEQLTSMAKQGLMRSPSGDSDKENWLPGDRATNSRRRPLPQSEDDKPSTTKSVLGDNHNILSHASNLGGAGNGRNRKRKSQDIGANIFEDEENVVGGEEVQKFMTGEVSPSKKGDLDCIQGLLSLSQGNWR